MNVPCTPSTPREKFRPSLDRTLNSTRLRPDGCKSRARVPSRQKRIPCRPPPKGKRIWVTERARKHGKNKDTTRCPSVVELDCVKSEDQTHFFPRLVRTR